MGLNFVTLLRMSHKLGYKEKKKNRKKKMTYGPSKKQYISLQYSTVFTLRGRICQLPCLFYCLITQIHHAVQII